MPKITNEAIFNVVQAIAKTVDKLQNDFTGMKNDFTGMKNDFTGMKNDFTGMKNDFIKMQNDFTKMSKKQDNMLVKLINLEHWAKEKDVIIEKIEKEVALIKTIVEKDATKQKNHEVEHVANLSAHDRLDFRIKALERAKK